MSQRAALFSETVLSLFVFVGLMTVSIFVFPMIGLLAYGGTYAWLSGAMLFWPQVLIFPFGDSFVGGSIAIAFCVAVLFWGVTAYVFSQLTSQFPVYIRALLVYPFAATVVITIYATLAVLGVRLSWEWL